MARFGQDKIEEVRARADIVEIVGAQVRLKRAGRNLVGLCPFHNEKTPSFSVNAERGFFHCFGCGAGGTVFDFVMRVEALTFAEALQSLARRYGIALPEHSSAGGAPGGERDALALVNQTAAEFFEHVLWKTEEGTSARDYLKARGISEETARAFMLGFAPARPANLAGVVAKRGMLDAAVKAGLVKRYDDRPPYDMFRARLMFPIRDAQGRVLGFGGRVLDQSLPKYINSPESPIYSKARALYGVFEARQAIAKADRTIVVEGNIDAIALWQAGFKETVASLGTALTVDQLRLLSRYSRNIFASFDGDGAGRKASLRALEVFLGAGLLGRGVFIPAGFDPDTLVRDRGAQAFTELIEKAELLVDYFLREQAAAAGASLSGRARAAERVAEILRMVANPFEFDLLARKAADFLGVSEALLRKEAQKGRGVSQATRHSTREAAASGARASGVPVGESTVPRPDIGLIGIALLYPELRGMIFESRVFEAFDNHSLSQVLLDVCEAHETIDKLLPQIMERLEADQVDRLLAAIAVFEARPNKATPDVDTHISKIEVFKQFLEKGAGHGDPSAEERFKNCEQFATDSIRLLNARKADSNREIPVLVSSIDGRGT
jgi:DNA primase